jgi:NAD(P) transhydrogenase subunit alpha
VSADASSLYAKNIFEFMQLIVEDDGNFNFPNEDELVTASMLCHLGKVTSNS